MLGGTVIDTGEWCGNASADGEIQDGELLLLDMGCEYYRYGSDITVTFPASGKFTPQQKGIYEIVLATHAKIKEAIQPGGPPLLLPMLRSPLW